MKPKETGEAVRISHTKAVLDARGAFSRLRRLVPYALRESSNTPGHMDDQAAIEAEIGHLIDVLTDAYHARDGMVPDSAYSVQQKDLRDEIEKLEKDLADAEETVEKYEELETENIELKKKLDTIQAVLNGKKVEVRS